jgi:hypothetical protein
MANKRRSKSTIVLFIILWSAGCGGQVQPELTATTRLVPTETPVPLPSQTFTSTETIEPTLTQPPQPATLTGTIFLSNEEIKPFASLVELRKPNSFTLIGRSETDSSGQYSIENIDPGKYELWILITDEPVMVTGCLDVAPPDDSWFLGIKFGEDKALTAENSYLSKGLLLIENLQSSELIAQGFFAVLENFEIKSGIENTMDVTLICK